MATISTPVQHRGTAVSIRSAGQADWYRILLMPLLLQEGAAQDALRSRLEAEVDMCQELLEVCLLVSDSRAGKAEVCAYNPACCTFVLGCDSAKCVDCSAFRPWMSGQPAAMWGVEASTLLFSQSPL
jgi:hypothetical protein